MSINQYHRNIISYAYSINNFPIVSNKVVAPAHRPSVIYILEHTIALGAISDYMYINLCRCCHVAGLVEMTGELT